jgi:magnesium transporter
MAKSPSSVGPVDHAIEEPLGRDGELVQLAPIEPECLSKDAPEDTPDAPEGTTGAAPTPRIRLSVLDGSAYSELEGQEALEALPDAVARGCPVWIDICDGDVAFKNEVSSILGLHPLLAEDLAERDQRAKLEEVGELLHLVLFSLGFEDGEIYERELDFVLGRKFLLTNHSRWWDPRAVRLLHQGVAEPMARGLDHLLWVMADDVIDAYFPILDKLGDEIDSIEDRVVTAADVALLEHLFDLKRGLIRVRRVTSPEREMFNILSNRAMPAISEAERLYFRDAYDHLIRLTDEIDTYRELASAALDTYLTTVNNNLSLIMKRLTGVTVVVAGVGAIAGIFGMSEAQTAFRLDEGPGFWLVSFGSLLLALGAAALLRKWDWI